MQPLRSWGWTGRARSVLGCLLLALVVGCGAERPTKVPGESDIAVSDVTLRSADGSDLSIDYDPLIPRLGMRADSLVLPMRYYSEFREYEDRRRITAYWQSRGFFDVEVALPITEFDQDQEEPSVALTWEITENERYSIHSVHLLHAPEEHEDALAEMISFGPGTTDIDFETFRKHRVEMAGHLRDHGYGHAMVYSRAFVDRDAKEIHWYYYVDAGPKTKIGKIVVDANVRVPADLIIERSGMVPGEEFNWAKSRAGEFDLLDTGAFASVFIRGSTDTVFIVPGDAPDTGGVLRDEQVDANGDLVPRELPEEVDLKIHVVEAPSQQLRVRAGAEFDPTRIDTGLASRLWLRNLFGPWHHLVLEGRLGYGWLWRDTTDDPTGLYGEALVRYLKPMLGARLLDFRWTARLRDELHPGFHLLELTTGPGVRSTLAQNLFFDTDLFFRYGLAIDFGPFDAATRDEFSLPEEEDFLGPELQSSIVWDERDNPVEALSGHLLALRASFTPGDPLGTHRYLTLRPEARGFLPLTDSFSIGLRGEAGWALLGGDDGVPLGPRLFGGGAYGMRGFGRHRLSPTARSCPTPPAPGAAQVDCELGPVGGLSLVEASVEARLLPYLKPYGLVGFADFGGAGAEYNPFDTGVSMALGAGLRLRIWYLPIAFDAAYRLLRDNELQQPEDDPFLVFFRIGESF